MRQAILDAVRASPGIHLSALQRQLGIGWGTLSYHVRVLRGHSAIQSTRQGRQVHLFLPGVSRRQMEWLSVLQEPVAVAILETLRARPGMGTTGMCLALRYSPRMLRRYLVRLDEEGIIERRGRVRPQYHVSSDFNRFQHKAKPQERDA